MANLIQIKRSLNTATAPSLANGELAFTANGDHLFIGSNGASFTIAGKFNPGVLTANQALVANGSSAINNIIVANLVPTVVYANGSIGTAGQRLTSNGSTVYWETPLPGVAGANTSIQFNDSSSLAGSANLTFDKITNLLYVPNVNTASLNVTGFTANSTRVSISTGAGLEANGGIGNAGQVLHSNGTTAYWANTTADITEVIAGDAAGRRQCPANLRDPRLPADGGGGRTAGAAGTDRGPDRGHERPLPLRRPRGAPRREPHDRAWRDDRPGGHQRLRQVHAGEPHLPVL